MGTLSQQYAERALEFMLPTQVIDGSEKPVIVRGSGLFVRDVQGREYMDMMAGPGILATGHCHPEVVAAGQEQLATLTQTTGATMNPYAVALAERIAQLAPGDLGRTFFCNSGAEANEGAVKLAMKYASAKGKTGTKIICLEHAFHGRLALSLAMTDFNKWKRGLEGFVRFPDIVRVPAPYYYRSYAETPEECVEISVEAVRRAIDGAGGENVAAFIMEPILGVGGVVVPPPGYHARVAELCRRHDITLIFDEVFTGFGRTGAWFASQHFGVVPDVMSIAKTVGGGLPLGGFVANQDRAAVFTPADHNTTFGGSNVVSLVMGLKVLEIIERDRLVENARARGEQLLKGFSAHMESSPIIGEVRGKGLFIGVEIVEDKQTRRPAPDLARQLRLFMQDHGILVGVAGDAANVFKISPPLIINAEQADHFLTVFGQALEVVGAKDFSA